MKKRVLLIVPLFLALLISGVFAQSATDTSVTTTNDAKLGTYLTDPEGMTLYIFLKDEPGSGKSTCYDTCAENWPAFTTDDPLILPEGVSGELTQITRDDGTMQVAYNGWPLYYFAKDTKAGDTNGQGIGDVWYVVGPASAPGATPMASPAASPVASPAASPTT